MRETVFNKTTGHWRSLLIELGVNKKHLTGKHGPCPICGGKDRFRFDDKDGRGTYYCNGCGPGTPLTLLNKMFGWQPAEVAQRLERIMGGRKAAPVRSKPVVDLEAAEQARRERSDAMREYWQGCRPLTPACLVLEYLRWRGIDLEMLPEGALINIKQRIIGNKVFEMVCAVRGPGGQGAQIHRTMINGNTFKVIKRLLWRGEFPPGSAVPLFRPQPYAPLGIAEGVETAISAAVLFGHPVWAALNAARLQTWVPPPREACDGLVIFADNDPAGQQAASKLWQRLKAMGHHVEIKTPVVAGADWNDILAAQQSSLARQTGSQQ